MSDHKVLIDEVREIVRSRFAQMTRGVGEFRETYLMSDSKFSGVRFEQGPFKATWTLDNTDVRVMRDDQQILLISTSSSSASKRAA